MPHGYGKKAHTSYFYSFSFNSSCNLTISSRYCAAWRKSRFFAASFISSVVSAMLFSSCLRVMRFTTGSAAKAAGSGSIYGR